jgi:hypothetical protein
LAPKQGQIPNCGFPSFLALIGDNNQGKQHNPEQEKMVIFLLDFGTGSARMSASCGCDRQSVNGNCNHRNPPVVSFTPQLKRKKNKNENK